MRDPPHAARCRACGRRCSPGSSSARESFQDRLRILLPFPGLVFKQNRRHGARFGTAMDPRARSALHATDVFLQHLHGRFIATDERLRQQPGMHGVIVVEPSFYRTFRVDCRPVAQQLEEALVKAVAARPMQN